MLVRLPQSKDFNSMASGVSCSFAIRLCIDMYNRKVFRCTACTQNQIQIQTHEQMASLSLKPFIAVKLLHPCLLLLFALSILVALTSYTVSAQRPLSRPSSPSPNQR